MLRSHQHRPAARRLRFWPTADSRQPTAASRRGLTLIEMLMAMAITLLMMAAVVTLFANLSGSIRNRRAAIEMNSQLRQVRHRLARDLAGCTVPLNDEGLVPWQRPGEAIGYFEIVEGNQSDSDPSDLLDDDDNDDFPDGIDEGTSLIPRDNNGNLVQRDNSGDIIGQVNALGDFDDILALTVRSESEPFVGLYEVERPPGSNNWEPEKVESMLAEVVWYALEAEPGNVLGVEPGMRLIYRRVLLIAPWLTSVRQGGSLIDFHQRNDLSVHVEKDANLNDIIVPNVLADLTRREYRYGRGRFTDFPHYFDRDRLEANPKYLVLNDALAFDVRVFDPKAPLYSVSGGIVVDPTDQGWRPAARGVLPASIVGYGAYVDLGWNNGGDYLLEPAPHFQFAHQAGWHPGFGVDPTPTTPNPNPNNPARDMPAVYDTWSWHYENDRVDQYNNAEDSPPGDGTMDRHIDDATDGIDDDGKNGVDDAGERETWPPYNVPLRGVRVILRTYEFDSRQIREASVTSSFVP